MTPSGAESNQGKQYCAKLGKKCKETEILDAKDSCFLGMPFRPEIRGRVGLMLQRFLTKNNIRIKVADEYEVPFLVDCNICKLIKESVFGVFEITELNPNVIYELGYCHGLGKPCFLLVDKSMWNSKPAIRKRQVQFGKKDMPIDFRNICTIYYDGYERIERKLEKGILQLHKEGYVTLSGEVLNQLGYTQNSNPGHGNNPGHSLDPKIVRDPQKLAKILYFVFVAYHYYISKDFGKSLEFAEKALEMSKELQPMSNPTIYDLLHMIGDIHYSQQSFDRAISVYQSAFEFAQSLEGSEVYRKGQVDILHQIANIHLQRSDLKNAEKAIRKSLELCKHLNYEKGLASGYYSQGIIHERKKELEEAFQIFRKTLSISKRIAAVSLSAMSLLEIGNILLLQEKYEHALRNYRKGLRISTQIEDKHLTAAFNLKLGIVNLLNGERGKASERFNIAYQLFAEEKDKIAAHAVKKIIQTIE